MHISELSKEQNAKMQVLVDVAGDYIVDMIAKYGLEATEEEQKQMMSELEQIIKTKSEELK